MYVMCILLVWVALTTCWSDAEPAYKADSASPPPVVLRRLSPCSLHFCISSDIIKNIKVKYEKISVSLNNVPKLITSSASSKATRVKSLFQYKNNVQ